jgi:hypothetical protein
MQGRCRRGKETARASFVSLPRVLQHAILRRVPVDARARCACVHSGWRAAVDDVSLWTRLDLSRSSGVTCTVNDAALRCASGLARGGLTALDVSGCLHVTPRTLLEVATANSRSLTELRACGLAVSFAYNTAETFMHKAPRLRVLHVDVRCDAGAQLLSMLRNEAPVGPLRVHRVHALFHLLAPAEHAAAVTALAAATAAHDSLPSLTLHYAALYAPDVLDAAVDAALLRRIRSLELSSCHLSPASAPALARLLGGSALTQLDICNGGEQLLDAPAAALLADALRSNSTITKLSLYGVSLSYTYDVADATVLLGALTGHPSLHTLEVHDDGAEGAYGAALSATALGALVAANAPALRQLSFSLCRLGDAVVAPLVDALPGNTHLRALDVGGNNISDEFARTHVLPAVRANTSLRTLVLSTDGYAATPAVHEAETLVAARAAEHTPALNADTARDEAVAGLLPKVAAL